MKMRLAVALAGLAIGFVLPTFAQQKDTVGVEFASLRGTSGVLT